MPGQIKYNGKVLVTMKDGTTVELNTTKKELQGNLEIAVEGGGITPTGTLDITANGNYDVTEKAFVDVNVPTSAPTVLVEGEATPTEADQEFTPTDANGYSKFTVKKIPSGYVKPSGTLEITEEGSYDVSGYASVVVKIGESFTGATVTVRIYENEWGNFGPTNTSFYQSDSESGEWEYLEDLYTTNENEVFTIAVTKPYVAIDNVASVSGAAEKMDGHANIDGYNSWYPIYKLTGDATFYVQSTCLTGDTLVTMADGSEKRIDEIELGDEVLSYDFSTMTLVPNKVIYTDKDAGKTHTEYDVWTFSDGSFVKTVHRHRFYNVERKAFVYMDEWQMGEHAVNINGEKVALVSHERVEETVNHYKITGEKGTNYFANGLLTGDRYCPDNIEL